MEVLSTEYLRDYFKNHLFALDFSTNRSHRDLCTSTNLFLAEYVLCFLFVYVCQDQIVTII